MGRESGVAVVVAGSDGWFALVFSSSLGWLFVQELSSIDFSLSADLWRSP